MITLEEAMVAAALASAASALRAFLCASFSARFWASRERVEVAAARASRGILSANSPYFVHSYLGRG
jgi:hypothetical protein